MMVQAASPSVEPNYTITDFTGNGTTSVTVDLGISNPSIIIVYPKTPLSSGKFPNSNNNYRLFIFHDTNYGRDLYCNTRSNTSTGYYVTSAQTPRLEYANGVLDKGGQSTGFLNDYEYRAVAIKQASSDVAITEVTGQGAGSISVDLGISNPSFLFVCHEPSLSAVYPSSTSNMAVCFFDHDVSTARNYYSTGRNTSSAGYLNLGSVLSYQNGTLTVGNTTVLQNGANYLIIAI
jgi:hypothetical protein